MPTEPQGNSSAAPGNYLAQEIEGSDRLARKIGTKYTRGYSVKSLYDRQSRFILDFLKKRNVRNVVEIGCGMGNFLALAQAEVPQVYGVDPAPDSLWIARSILPDAKILQGQGETLPFASNSVGAFVMKGVVHHLQDPTVVFRELRRCLVPGGYLVIFEGNRSSLYRRTVLGFADLFRYDHESTLFEHRAPKAMKRMLEESGLAPILLRNISGLFAPLALFGVGGRALWNVLFPIENAFQRICPFLFNYYVMLVAQKPE